VDGILRINTGTNYVGMARRPQPGSYVSDAGTFVLAETAIIALLRRTPSSPLLQLNGQDRFRARGHLLRPGVKLWQHPHLRPDTPASKIHYLRSGLRNTNPKRFV
jgi:hypothetical protein